MSGYDTAITVFSPNGHLFQVEYAMEAVNKGLCAVGARGKDCIVLGVERKTIPKLQESKSVKKMYILDEHICMAFAGLNADARIIANLARVDCQSYRLTYEVQPSIDYVAKQIGLTKQKYTQKSGARPYGISILIGGFDDEKMPKLYQTDPSGACIEYKAISIGRNFKTVNDFLEKNFKLGMTKEETIQLVCKALMDVVESGSKNIEIAVIELGKVRIWTDEEVDVIVKELEKTEKKKK